MISFAALKARAKAEHPQAELAYLPAEKGHSLVLGQPLPRVQHAGVRAQSGDMEHFYWANGDTSMRRASISASVYKAHGEDAFAALYPMGAPMPVWRPHWTAAQRQQAAPQEVPTDLPVWSDLA